MSSAELAGDVLLGWASPGVVEDLPGVAVLDPVAGPPPCVVSTDRNAVLSATRLACCRLCVAMVLVGGAPVRAVPAPGPAPFKETVVFQENPRALRLIKP